MHEILKRALDEALTAAYAGEIPAGAEEAAFSEGFERKMRGLIRKTDRPIQKYIPILTAAACAVIAIGCAVLLPRLLSHSIPVETSDSTATVVSPVTVDEPVESTSAAETDSDETEEIRDENPGAAGIADPSDDRDANPNYGLGPDELGDENPDAADEEDTTEWDDEDDLTTTGITDSEETAETEEDSAVENTEAESGDTVDEDTEADDDDSENTVTDDSDDDDTSYVDDEDDSDYDSDDDDVSSDDDDVSSDDDDVASDDDDVASGDSDADYDNDEAADESTLPPIAKRATLNGEVEALLGCSLADSYLHNGDLMIDGKFYGVPIVEGIDPETYRDPALAERIGAAKYIEGEPEEIGLPLFWGNIGKEPPAIKPAYESDQSDRNHYDELYFEGDRWIEDVEDEDEDDEPTVYLEFLRNGIVRVFRDGYSGSAYYRLDDETLETLTERIETRFRTSEPETVGDLMKQLGSAEDYARVYVGIRDYYDCTMYGAVSDGSFLADLLQKYKKEKLQTGSNSEYAPIRIELVSRKTLRTEYFVFYADGTVRVGGDKFFKADEADVCAILTEYCRQKNLPAPVFYETLGEYLEGKNFTTLTYVCLYGKDWRSDLLLNGDSAELRALIEEYAAESTFIPDRSSDSPLEQENIAIQVEGWFPSLRISRNEIRIGMTNIFRTPDGLYEKLCAVISEKGELRYMGQDEDYWDDDVAEEVTDD